MSDEVKATVGEPGGAGGSGGLGAPGKGIEGGQGGVGGAGGVGGDGSKGDPGNRGEQGKKGDTGKTGQAGTDAPGGLRFKLGMTAIVIVLALVFGWAVQGMYAATDKLAAAQTRDDCFADVLTALVEANDEAAELAARTALAARENVAAQAQESAAGVAVMTASLSAGAEDLSEEEAASLVQSWLDATTAAQTAADAYVALSVELAAIRREHPAPDVAAVEACR